MITILVHTQQNVFNDLRLKFVFVFFYFKKNGSISNLISSACRCQNRKYISVEAKDTSFKEGDMII